MPDTPLPAAPHPDSAPLNTAPLRILLTGGTGFIGTALVARLQAQGHSLHLWVRDAAKARARFSPAVRCESTLEAFGNEAVFDAVINLAGAPVVGPPWTAARRAQLLQSRVGVTEQLLAWLAQQNKRPALWIQASAIGFYGVRPPAEELDEQSAPGSGFMHTLCAQWEAAARGAEALQMRCVTLRLGLVFGHGGALPALLMPHRFGLGGRLGDGKQVMSWVHLADVLAVTERALGDASMQGVYNLVAPETVTQAEFARSAGALFKRPVWLHLPAWPLRLLLGEMAQLFVDGQRVLPRRLLSAGQVFQFPTLQAALADLRT